jgi:hypothetical protein
MNYNEIRRISKSQLEFILKNKKKLPEYSFLLQYMNESVLKGLFNLNHKIYNIIENYPSNTTFLNIGMGAGFLEYYVEKYQKVNLESVEKDSSFKKYLHLKEEIGIDKRNFYLCGNIKKENFQIYDCNKSYDYIILIRFTPLNKLLSPLVSDLEIILNRLKKYSNKFIIVDDERNFNNEVIKYFENKRYKEFPINNEWIRCIEL